MLIEITVAPRSSRSVVIKNADGSFKVRLTSAPVDGKANYELIEMLAEYFDTAKSNIEIVKGLTTKRKLVRIQVTKKRK